MRHTEMICDFLQRCLETSLQKISNFTRVFENVLHRASLGALIVLLLDIQINVYLNHY